MLPSSRGPLGCPVVMTGFAGLAAGTGKPRRVCCGREVALGPCEAAQFRCSCLLVVELERRLALPEKQLGSFGPADHGRGP